jgi:hypothetical protein
MSGLHPAWCDGILAGNQTKNAKFHDVFLIAWRNGAQRDINDHIRLSLADSITVLFVTHQELHAHIFG